MHTRRILIFFRLNMLKCTLPVEINGILNNYHAHATVLRCPRSDNVISCLRLFADESFLFADTAGLVDNAGRP